VVEDSTQKGKKLSSQGGTSSASKGGMSKKSAATSPVVQGIRADQYAQKKLGITGPQVYNTPSGEIMTKGFTSSTVPSQMYGQEYSAARNEYLASQGLGTMQKNGSFITGVQTDKGLVFTSKAREAYEASRREKMPLSKEMYESQRKTSNILGGLAAAATGMSMFFTSQYTANKMNPYSTYVQNFYKTANRSSTSIASSRNKKNTTTTTTAPTTSDNVKASVSDSTTVAKNNKRRNASSYESGSLPDDRTFLARTDKTIRGSMVG
jgi:hypothetical protein